MRPGKPGDTKSKVQIAIKALRQIIAWTPDMNKDETSYTEWGYAECFDNAQRVAQEALDQIGKHQ